jgi:hypothetical protein
MESSRARQKLSEIVAEAHDEADSTCPSEVSQVGIFVPASLALRAVFRKAGPFSLLRGAASPEKNAKSNHERAWLARGPTTYQRKFIVSSCILVIISTRLNTPGHISGPGTEPIWERRYENAHFFSLAHRRRR